MLPRRTAVDLLRVADPRGVSTPARPGEYGVGPLFSFPLQSVESVLPLRGDQVLVANDNNFPGNDGRIPGRADDTELIVVRRPHPPLTLPAADPSRRSRANGRGSISAAQPLP